MVRLPPSTTVAPVYVFAPFRRIWPLPDLVNWKPVPLTAPLAVRTFVELFVQVCEAARATLSVPKLVGFSPKVTTPTPEFMVMPPAPIESKLTAVPEPPARMLTLPVVLKVRERALRLPPPFEITVLEFALVMLKKRSAVVVLLGAAPGSAVPAAVVDHADAVVQVAEDRPSQ
jgi:hypothetical protein